MFIPRKARVLIQLKLNLLKFDRQTSVRLVSQKSRIVSYFRNVSLFFCCILVPFDFYEDRSPNVLWYKVVWCKNMFLDVLLRPSQLYKQGYQLVIACMHRQGINIPTTCLFCSDGQEIHEHLFFQCHFSMQICENITFRICILNHVFSYSM